jgi:hypothetical protein
MNLPKRLFLSAACILPMLATTSMADDRRTISANASTYEARLVARALFAAPKSQKLRPFERVLLNTAVYRYEGNPTMRHDEVSSPEIIFHTRNGKIRAGHDWDTRD